MNLLQRFQQQLEALSLDQSITNYVVGYSGGLDSHVLLHLCSLSRIPLRAVHIHHGLQKEADQWSQHCEQICQRLAVPFKNIHVDASAGNGESPENAARKARYNALQDELHADEVLFTAHHRDDQSETLMLQLMRGAGPAGLAAMPVLRKNKDMWHARPLLEFSRDDLLAYAKEENLKWIEDSSNKNTEYDRNRLRQEIIPDLKQRWPHLDVSLSQVATQQQGVLEIIEAMAAVDFAGIITQQRDVVSITALKKLSVVRQSNVLRYWIKQNAKDVLTANILQQLTESVLTASEDAEPVLSWGETEIRRYQDGLYIVEKLSEHDESISYTWTPNENLVIDSLGVEISAQETKSGGLSKEYKNKVFSVRFRQGGEKIQPTGRNHTHSIKKLMQEANIPSWQRSRIPLIYLDEQLVCVCGYWVDKTFAANDGESGWQVDIKM